MQLSKFITELNQNKLVWLQSNQPEEEIYSFKPFPTDRNFEQNVIYIGLFTALPKSPCPEILNFLCINNYREPKQFELNKDSLPNSNILILTTSLNFRGVCDLASGVFLAEAKYTSYINRMTLASNANKGLNYLVDEGYKILKSPLIVVDTSFKILAMYNDGKVEERPDLDTQRELGYLTEQNILRMKQDRVYEKAREAKYPYYEKAEGEKYGWMNVIVYIHGIEVAQIGTMELDHSFTHYDYEFFNFFSQLISWEMQKNDFYKNNRGVMHSVFLSELLDCKIPSQRIVNLRKEQLNWIDTPFLYVFTIFDEDINGISQRAQIIANQIKPFLATYRYVIYDSKLVILIQQTEEKKNAFESIGALKEYLKTNHLTGILSNCFSDLLQIRKYYEQTLKIYDLREMIPEEISLYLYADYMFYHIGQIISEKYDLADFYHPAIFKMIQYDKDNQSHFIETLHEYLTYIDNPTLSAKHLFIHKNTFFYRMNKIRELFDLDLNDGEERLKLHLTLEFLKLEEFSSERKRRSL